MHQRFANRFIGVLQFDVFPDQGDVDRALNVVEAVQEVVPGRMVGLPVAGCGGQGQHQVVKTLLVHQHRNFVDRGCVDALDHGFGRDIAELGYLASHSRRDITLAAQHQDVGLDADGLQLLHRVLRRLGLQLLCRPEVGYIRQMQAQGVMTQFPFQLSHGLEEGRGFDVADRAADFGDDEIVFARIAQFHHVALDLVCDVRNNLDRLAQIGSAALLVDDALVYAARREAVVARGVDVGEALVMAQVQIGLVAVGRHIAFPVLVGVEGTRVYVQVGIEFLNRHAESARKQQSRKRCRYNAFAKRGHYAPGHKYIFCCHEMWFGNIKKEKHGRVPMLAVVDSIGEVC